MTEQEKWENIFLEDCAEYDKKIKEEQKAEELWKKADKYVVTTGNNDCTIDAYIAGYHECQKEHEWHYVKDGDLPKEYCIVYYKDSFGEPSLSVVHPSWYIAGVEAFFKNNPQIIAWKEIVLPKEIE